jgi:hypothetical protein
MVHLENLILSLRQGNGLVLPDFEVGACRSCFFFLGFVTLTPVSPCFQLDIKRALLQVSACPDSLLTFGELASDLGKIQGPPPKP